MHMKKLMLFLFILFSVSSFAQLKAEDVKSFTLKNGMKFLVLEDNSIPNANMYVFYRVGSRNEHPGVTGLSHFFEHMMFNGAKKYGPKLFDQTMEFNGGANNAYTTPDVTVYTNWFPSSATEVIFDLEADRISSLNIDEKMVESERGVVISERSTGLENSPWRLLSENVQATAFQESAYHWPVIGYEPDIKNWTKQELENDFRTYYAPNNAGVVMSGAVKYVQIKALEERYLEPVPSRAGVRQRHLTGAGQECERRIVMQKRVAEPYFAVAYQVPESDRPHYYALDLLKAI